MTVEGGACRRKGLSRWDAEWGEGGGGREQIEPPREGRATGQGRAGMPVNSLNPLSEVGGVSGEHGDWRPPRRVQFCQGRRGF